MTDPIADMLTQIRNALLVAKPEVVLPYSTFKHQLAQVLVREGLLEAAAPVEESGRKRLRMKLRYIDGKPAISGLKRVSSPGQRMYARSDALPRTLNGFGVTIISTSRGLLTDAQARQQRVGGEIICQVW